MKKTLPKDQTAERRRQMALMLEICECMQVSLSMFCSMSATEPGLEWADGIEAEHTEQKMDAAITQGMAMYRAMMLRVAGDQADLAEKSLKARRA